MHARGSLNLLNVELLRGTVEVLIASGRVEVTIDLSKINFVDQTGLLLLGSLRDDLEYRGGRLTLVNPQRSVNETLRRAQLPVTEGIDEVDSDAATTSNKPTDTPCRRTSISPTPMKS